MSEPEGPSPEALSTVDLCQLLLTMMQEKNPTIQGVLMVVAGETQLLSACVTKGTSDIRFVPVLRQMAADLEKKNRIEETHEESQSHSA